MSLSAFTAANTAPPFSSLGTLPHTQITTVPLRPKNAASSFRRQCQVRRMLLTFPGQSSIVGGENTKPAVSLRFRYAPKCRLVILLH